MGKSDTPEKKAAPAKAKTTKAVAAKKPAAATAAAKPATVKPVAAPKAVAPKKAAPAPVAPPTAPTSDEIGLRAYFISEKRHQLGLPGDSSQDWVEAERQLLEEAKAKKPVKKKA